MASCMAAWTHCLCVGVSRVTWEVLKYMNVSLRMALVLDTVREPLKLWPMFVKVDGYTRWSGSVCWTRLYLGHKYESERKSSLIASWML